MTPLDPQPLPCPECDNPLTRWLKYASDASAVDYYRCLWCGRVWMTGKTNRSVMKHLVRTPVPGAADRECPR